MSHIPLQRVIVRMMYDAAFRSAIYADPVSALAAVDVSPEEAGWLTARDPRAYATDPHVRGRALHGLLSEYCVSGAIALRAGVSLDSFFSSNEFHRCIQQGQSLSLCFGEWLVEATADADDGGALARIEAGMATLRRGIGVTSQGDIRLASHLRVLQVTAGALDHFQAALTGMQAQNEDPSTVALDTRFSVPAIVLEGEEQETLLLEATETGIGAEILPDGLADLLVLATDGTSSEALEACLNGHGVDRAEATEIVDSLVNDGLLARG